MNRSRRTLPALGSPSLPGKPYPLHEARSRTQFHRRCEQARTDKPDCNLHRTTDDESSCTSSLTFVDGVMGRKVCRPPNSGTATTDGSAG
jgi:hypothetical protein